MKKFGSHAIRHYFATELIRKGVNIYKVSKILGHASIKITESIYVHLLPIDLLGITDVLD
jgi:integrase/recombinase XerD